MLHRLAEGAGVHGSYAEFDYKKVVALITSFMVSDLSAFYFDIRKDTLYCDPPRVSRARARSRQSTRFSKRVTSGSRRSSLHLRGGLALALSFGARFGAHARFSHQTPPIGAMMRSRQNGERSVTFAASSPARWRSSAPPNVSALRSKRRRSYISKMSLPAPPSTASISPKSASRRISKSVREGSGGRFPAGRCSGRRRRAATCQGPQMRALVENLAARRQRSRISRI